MKENTQKDTDVRIEVQSLAGVVLPENAFSHLDTIILPDTLTSVSPQAFEDCIKDQ